MQELERERKDRLAATARCCHCPSRPSRFPVLNVKLSPGLMCCSRGSLSCKSHAMKQTPEQVTRSLWLVTARSPHISLSTASLAAKLVAATAATVPQPSSHSHDAATTCLFLLRSFLESAASSGPMSSPISTFQRLFYIKFRPFPFSFLCAGALNKSAAAAASIIISSLSYSCDHTQLPHVHVPQLLMV